MRVLLVCGSYPPMRCGVGDYTAQLAQALQRVEGVSVAVLTSDAAAGGREGGVELFPVARTWGIAETGTIVGGIRRWNPDIVHVQYPTLHYGAIQWILPALARIANGPVVQTWHEHYDPRNWPSVLNAALPGGLVVVRPRYLENVPAWYRWLLHAKEFRFIPNASSIPPVRLTDEERAATRSELGAAGSGLVAYFGFSSPAKGIESLFEIADPSRHRLVLICDLSAGDAYQASILSLGNRGEWAGKVVVTGFLPPEKAGRLLAAADAAIFPFRHGGGEWNSSIHGAASQGTFVLTTSVDRKGYDPAENIYYARPGDIQEMRRALRDHMGIRRPLHDPPASRWDAIAGEHLDLYRTLLVRRRKPVSGLHGTGGDR